MKPGGYANGVLMKARVISETHLRMVVHDWSRGSCVIHTYQKHRAWKLKARYPEQEGQPEEILHLSLLGVTEESDERGPMAHLHTLICETPPNLAERRIWDPVEIFAVEGKCTEQQAAYRCMKDFFIRNDIVEK